MGDVPVRELNQDTADVHGPTPRPTGPVRTDREAGALVRELRDDERY